MKRYSQLADLETLILDVQDETVRAYVAEAIASYSVGSYRSVIVSVWIAVVYDLYQKIRLLSEQYGDKAAQQCIEETDKIRNSPDKKQVSAWEREILTKAYKNIKMLTLTEYEHLDRIQQDRHRCAHPVLDSEGFLFQPSPELSRSHIRTAVDTLFSKPPIIGKAASDALQRDVEGMYFGDKLEEVKNALKGRHLSTSEPYRLNLFKLCLKKILYLEPNDSTIIKRYILVLRCLFEDYKKTFYLIDRNTLNKIFDTTREDRYRFLANIINIDKSFWNEIPDFTKEKFKSFLRSSSTIKEKLCVLPAFKELEAEVISEYEKLSIEEKQNFIDLLKELEIEKNNPDLVHKLVRQNIDVFTRSGSWYNAQNNALYYLQPVINFLKADDVNYLLEKAVTDQEKDRYDQLKDCTPVMVEVFKVTINKFPETLATWKTFLEKKRDRDWDGIEDLAQLITARDESHF